MSHNVETMAFAGATPWHGLGVNVPGNLTPFEMQKAAGLDWEAVKVPVYAHIGKRATKGYKELATGEYAIVRDSDGAVLSPSVGKGWKPVSNREVFETFVDIVTEAKATMETAGSLQGGRIIWALAKMSDEFDILGGDKTKGYLFLSASHKFGMATRADFTAVRIVCNNTLNAALEDKSAAALVIQHRTEFDAAKVAEFMGVSHAAMELRRKQALALAAKKASEDDLKMFYNLVWPITSEDNVRGNELSARARMALTGTNNPTFQPGTEFAPGSWWQAFNTVTYMVDHVMAREADTRMFNAMLSTGRTLKVKAMNKALELAGADVDLAEAA